MRIPGYSGAASLQPLSGSPGTGVVYKGKACFPCSGFLFGTQLCCESVNYDPETGKFTPGDNCRYEPCGVLVVVAGILWPIFN
jgi:hypothetical protein